MPRATRPRYTAEGFGALNILLAHIKHETDLNNAAECGIHIWILYERYRFFIDTSISTRGAQFLVA